MICDGYHVNHALRHTKILTSLLTNASPGAIKSKALLK
jgi:hypothetical protein